MPLALGGLVDLFERAELDAEALSSDDDPLVRGRSCLMPCGALAERADAWSRSTIVQWLDSASARALRYAMRRLETEPIGILRRLGSSRGRSPLGAARACRPGSSESSWSARWA